MVVGLVVGLSDGVATGSAFVFGGKVALLEVRGCFMVGVDRAEWRLAGMIVENFVFCNVFATWDLLDSVGGVSALLIPLVGSTVAETVGREFINGVVGISTISTSAGSSTRLFCARSVSTACADCPEAAPWAALFLGLVILGLAVFEGIFEIAASGGGIP